MQNLGNYLNKIICGDSLQIMRQMPDKCIDLVVTSPPYKLKNSAREYCNHCGAAVSKHSGKFVNRVPDFNDILTRIDNNRRFPLGDFVCDDCDNNSLTDND